MTGNLTTEIAEVAETRSKYEDLFFFSVPSVSFAVIELPGSGFAGPR
jgi:hypothetical protein